MTIALGLWAVFGPIFAYVSAAMAAILIALTVLKVFVATFEGEAPPP